MAIRRLLLLLKPFDASPVGQIEGLSCINNVQMLHYLENRMKVQKDVINFCKHILRKKTVHWTPIFRDNLTKPIHDVDLVITLGGDGTLLQASHFLDDSIPVLGVNSDPTRVEEVEAFSNEFDATRSTGHLCAATVNDFEQVLDNILSGQVVPSELSRISVCVNTQLLTTYALNDILIADPCPASISRFSFWIRNKDQSCSPLVHCRSSGLRVSTAAGSTAAMLSAGGFPMHILSRELQYMVREPILPRTAFNLMHGVITSDQSIDTAWFCREGVVYIDGSHVCHSIQNGDIVKISSNAPILKVFLPQRLLAIHHRL